jgi:hypothetical protein
LPLRAFLGRRALKLEASMSILNHIIDDVNKGKIVTESWLMLKNAYFRGDTGLQDLKKWATENNIIVTERDIKEQSFDYIVFETVEFRKKTP